MNPTKTAGIVLIVAGALGLAYGGFTYTKSSQETQMGPFSMTVKDRQTVAIPIWAGLGAVLVGGVLLLIPAKKG
jgi:hypothetical protein